MLSKVEQDIARNILRETDDPNLAILAIVLRRLFPKIAMERLDMFTVLSSVHHGVVRLDKELQKGE